MGVDGLFRLLMGCAHSSGELQPREASASKDKGDVAAKQNLAPPPDMDPVNLGGFSSLLPVGGPLTAKEYRDRIQTSGGTRGEHQRTFSHQERIDIPPTSFAYLHKLMLLDQ